jgi:dihydroxyacetone kinase-like protein
VSALTETLTAVAAAVVAASDDLNRLDGAAGDGDLGITMSVAAQAALDAMAEGGTDAAEDLLRRIGLAIARRAPSTAGTLVATALLAASRIEPAEELPVAAIARRVRAGFTAIGDRGHAKVGDKSMLDALSPVVASLERDATSGTPLADALEHAAAAARDGSLATQSLTPRVGRAGWLAERSLGNEDAGAHMVAVVFNSIAASVVGRGPDTAAG